MNPDGQLGFCLRLAGVKLEGMLRSKGAGHCGSVISTE